MDSCRRRYEKVYYERSLPLRVLLYRKNVIKVCSECEEIINFGKYFGSGWGNKNDTQI